MGMTKEAVVRRWGIPFECVVSDLADQGLNLVQIAQAIGYSYDGLRHLFSRHPELSPFRSAVPAGEVVKIGRILAKRCPACGTTKELEAFNVRNRASSGCASECSACHTRYRLEWERKRHERHIAMLRIERSRSRQHKTVPRVQQPTCH